MTPDLNFFAAPKNPTKPAAHMRQVLILQN